MTIGLAWTACVAVLVVLIVVDARLREPARWVGAVFIALGCTAILNAAMNETRGRYSARSWIVLRNEEPEKFRLETRLHIVLGVGLVAAGAVLQIWGWLQLLRR